MGTPGDVPPSVAIVEAVADLEGADPADLEPSLAEVIDPDALDKLFADRHAGHDRAGRVSLRYAGHDVVIHGDGRVVVDDGSDERAGPGGDDVA